MYEPNYKRNYKLCTFHENTDHFWVTIPTPWVRAKNLKKGDTLVVEILSDGSLKISPERKAEADARPSTSSLTSATATSASKEGTAY